MFIIPVINIQQLSLRNMKKILAGCTNDVSVEEVWKMWKNPNTACFRLFLHPEAGLVMGIESSNPQWYMLRFNTITQRLLLLRQQAEIKAVSIGDSPRGGSVVSSLMFLLSLSSSPETPLPPPPPLPFNANPPKHKRNSPDKNHASALTSARTHSHIKTITSGNNDHERDAVWNCRGCLCCTAALMLNWGKKGKQSKWHLHIGWQPLKQCVEDDPTFPPNRLHL